jgi:L-lactate dehydrogenase complex protein LldG
MAAGVGDARDEGPGDLLSRFVRELEIVGGRAIVTASDEEAAEKFGALAKAENVSSVAMGQGVATDLNRLAEHLERAGIELVRANQTDDALRSGLRNRIAGCDLGLAEADYGIASTGTLAVAADESRPGLLTLLPALSVVILRVERIASDLAALLRTLGPAGVAANRLTLITGPSRTADIEKRIVIGVHGPRELYAILIGPR